VQPALGLYPEDALDRELEKENFKLGEKKGLKEIIAQIERNKESVIAIGEVGLDLFNGKNLNEQKEHLGELITLSIKLNKPIILHSRKAENQLLQFLKEFHIKSDKVILHCFSGNSNLIKQAIQEGYNFSVPTNLVRSDSFKNLVSLVPLNKLFTETDGPYLSPYKNEDKSFSRNEPAFIVESIKEIARIKNLQEKEVEKQIEENFDRVFFK
jgi:TatD DNase family protein